MTDKIKGYVPKTFKDSGTNERFEGGKEHMFSPGAHANYLAAGKITDKPNAGKSEAPAGEPKAADKTKAGKSETPADEAKNSPAA